MLTDHELFLLRLHKLSSELVAGSDLKRSLQRVLETSRQLLNFNRVYLFTKNQKKDLIEVLMAVGKYSIITKNLKWPAKTMGAPSYVFAKGKPLHLRSLKDERLSPYYPKQTEDKDVLLSVYKLARFGIGDTLLVPVSFRGRTIAVLAADKLSKHLSSDDLSLLQEFASQIGWAIENARLREENQLVMQNLAKVVDTRTQELKDIQAQLIHAERLAAMGEMVAGITHEIKNPLTGIVGFTELLKGYFADQDDEAKQIYNGLVTSVSHLQTVVKNFLSFAKKTNTAFESLDINSVLLDSLALTEYQLRKGKVTVQTRLSSELPSINGDRGQLSQVFTNLFMNAADAMPEGGTLSIHTQRRHQKVIITVSDTGCGIPEDQSAHIFKAFFTTKGQKGTGLGLSVSHNIIQNHTGEITVRSEVRKGTTFTISLPI